MLCRMILPGITGAYDCDGISISPGVTKSTGAERRVELRSEKVGKVRPCSSRVLMYESEGGKLRGRPW